MKIKNKIKLFVFLFILLFAGFFTFKITCLAEPILKITNIQFSGGAGKTDEDFVEITNTSADTINLNGYRLVKRTASGTTDTSIKSWTSDTPILSGEKYVWACSKNGFAESIRAYTSTTQTISETNGIAIRFGKENEGTIIDSLNWKKEDEPKDDEIPPDETVDYSKIKINEIYPAPETKNDEEEFVEIKYESEKTLDFSDWTIKDSKGAKGKISKTEKDGNFVVFYGSFSLNNDSKGDTVFIYDKKDTLIASQKYNAGKTAYSFAFDGSAWRWTSFATPGKENSFDKILSGKIILPEKIYPNAYAYFDVKSDQDAQKFIWNFGDNHKSYLKKTKHKYEKTGEYSASLKITGKGEDVLYDFVIKVDKYKAPKIQIISLSPNPQGIDTSKEWIEIKNNSKKKVNLKGWSIATGWKKMVNHPIREKFEIKAGKSKKLTKKICAFTLVNTKDKIELRDPSGKAVQKIKYNHGEKSVSEDGIYSKIDGGWEWIEPQSDTEQKQNDTEKIETQSNKETEQNETEEIILNIPNSEIQASLGKYTISTDWQKKKDNQIKFVYLDDKIKIPEIDSTDSKKVLGAQKINLQDTYYTFTRVDNQKHWIVKLSDFLLIKINSGLNKLLLISF